MEVPIDKKERREFWRRHVTQSREYSGTDVQYCAEHGLKLGTFYSQKGRLRLRSPGRGEARSSFSKVSVVTEKKPPSVKLPDPKWVAEFLRAWVLS